jgi:hypothetical protein
LRFAPKIKKPRNGGAFKSLGDYFFFFVAFFFAGAFFFVAILKFTSDPSSLYDYCSPLMGKLFV